MRKFFLALTLCGLAPPMAKANYNDLLFLNQMNDSYCTGNGGSYNGLTCSSRDGNGRVISVEEQERIKRDNARYLELSAQLSRAAGKTISTSRFKRRFPEVNLPVETDVTAPLFTCLRQRIAGLLLSEIDDATYARMINQSRYSFDAGVNVRDIFYWTQDILALSLGQDRFLLDFDKAGHRKTMVDLILREAPRAWDELQRAVALHDSDAVLAPDAGAKAHWFLTDTGLIYAFIDKDTPERLGRSFYSTSSCKNHWNATRSKLIPATGYFMDSRIEAFKADAAGTRLEGVLPF